MITEHHIQRLGEPDLVLLLPEDVKVETALEILDINKKEEPLIEFTLEYYKDQYEKLLNHNQELTQRVDELKKQVEPAALERIANIVSHTNSTRRTVIKLLGYLETELRNWATLADKAVALILIQDIEEVLSPSDDQDDY